MNPQTQSRPSPIVATSLTDGPSGRGCGPELFEIDLFRQTVTTAAAADQPVPATGRPRRPDQHPKA
ncbi:MAG: hypothetical protein GX442_19715 [Candidatus Riflebacteria bacterium]|nr:hypothetical protein [Candidatus Riflebacteria bacterium]